MTELSHEILIERLFFADSPDDIFLPFLVYAVLYVLRHFKVETTVWAVRRIVERHSRFFWGAIAFLDVAADASRDNVLPGVAAASRSRNHMIQSQIVPAIAAVLTGMTVAV